MEQLHKTKYFLVFYEPENHLFHYVFNENTKDMSSEEYVDELKVFIRLVKEYKPKRVLGDMVNFKFTIIPETQEWVNENLFAVYKEIDFKKIAILLGSGLFESISIKQTMEEETTNSFQTAYFDDKDKAKDWLLA